MPGERFSEPARGLKNVGKRQMQYTQQPLKRLGFVVAIVILSACGGGNKNPVAPTPPAPVIPACQANNTAELIFQNRSTANLTYSVFLDGLNVGIIGPNQNSAPQTVVAGVQHTMLWFYTNTNVVACSATPIPVRCTSQPVFCTF